MAEVKRLKRKRRIDQLSRRKHRWGLSSKTHEKRALGRRWLQLVQMPRASDEIWPHGDHWEPWRKQFWWQAWGRKPVWHLRVNQVSEGMRAAHHTQGTSYFLTLQTMEYNHLTHEDPWWFTQLVYCSVSMGLFHLPAAFTRNSKRNEDL